MSQGFVPKGTLPIADAIQAIAERMFAYEWRQSALSVAEKVALAARENAEQAHKREWAQKARFHPATSMSRSANEAHAERLSTLRNASNWTPELLRMKQKAEARLQLIERCCGIVREALHAGEIAAFLIRASDGQRFEVPAHFWASINAPNTLRYGSAEFFVHGKYVFSVSGQVFIEQGQLDKLYSASDGATAISNDEERKRGRKPVQRDMARAALREILPDGPKATDTLDAITLMVNEKLQAKGAQSVSSDTVDRAIKEEWPVRT